MCSPKSRGGGATSSTPRSGAADAAASRQDSFLGAQIFSHSQRQGAGRGSDTQWLEVWRQQTARESPAPESHDDPSGDRVPTSLAAVLPAGGIDELPNPEIDSLWNFTRTPVTPNAPCLERDIFPPELNLRSGGPTPHDTPDNSPLKVQRDGGVPGSGSFALSPVGAGQRPGRSSARSSSHGLSSLHSAAPSSAPSSAPGPGNVAAVIRRSSAGYADGGASPPRGYDGRASRPAPLMALKGLSHAQLPYRAAIGAAAQQAAAQPPPPQQREGDRCPAPAPPPAQLHADPALQVHDEVPEISPESDDGGDPAAEAEPAEQEHFMQPAFQRIGCIRTQSLDNIANLLDQADAALQKTDLGGFDQADPATLAVSTKPTQCLQLSVEGTQGTYFVSNCEGERIGVFKPNDEEVCSEGNPRGLQGEASSLKTGIPTGEGWRREIAAYRLDHGHFAGVPETFRFELPSRYFTHSCASGCKVGSLQRFVQSHGEAWDVLPGRLPLEAVHRIAVLDIRLCNSDRHGGNVLVVRDGEGNVSNLIPIDHAACAPTHLEDTEFEWLTWPQSKQPFSETTLKYISALDPEKDARILRVEVGLSQAAAENVRAASSLLKTAAARGLTAREIGELMRRPTIGEPSALEDALVQSRSSIDDGAAVNWEVLQPKMAAIVDAVVERKRESAAAVAG